MEKNIQRLLLLLRVEVLAVLTSVLCIFVFGQLDVIPNGLVEPKSQTEFVLNTIAVCFTLVGIPLALKLFQLNTTKALRRMNLDEALQSYHVWSLVRVSILEIAAVYGLVVYFFTMTTTGLLCALASLAILFVCWPSREKIDQYLQLNSSEN